MDQFHVKDVHGRVVVLYERTSILLTLATLLAGAAAAAMLLGAVQRLAEGAWVDGGGLLGGMAACLIYVFVFNHLRRKGDMNTGSAVLPSIQGGLVELRRAASMWVTLAMLATLLLALVLLVLGALAVLGASGHPRLERLVAAGPAAPRYYGGGSLILAGLFLLINVAVLRFLSVKAHVRLVEKAASIASPEAFSEHR